jgi:hypothetical protein
MRRAGVEDGGGREQSEGSVRDARRGRVAVVRQFPKRGP